MGKRWLLIFLVAAVVCFFSSVPVAASIKAQVSETCKSCHKSDGSTLWGFVRAGSQKDDYFQVQVDGDVWELAYDKSTKLAKNLTTIKELANEKIVMVRFKKDDNKLIATYVSYKTPPSFIPPDDVIETEELVKLLNQNPKDANYIIFDVRGVSNYQEDHIPMAQNLPIYRFFKFKDRLPKDKNTLIVAYCNSYG